ncbi:MAG: WecB/TagA/CpsF family glycosyltransferase [Bacteroidota bacterium]
MKAKIFDIDVDLLSEATLLNRIIKAAKGQEKQVIIGNVNIRALNFAYEQIKFRNFLNRCETIFCDGIGVLLAFKILGVSTNLNQRMTCPDYLDNLIELIIENNLSIFFLAGSSSMNTALDNKLLSKYPKLNYHIQNGFFDSNSDENKAVLQSINDFQPNILYVGFGMPLQEYWIEDNYRKINANVILPLGACLDFYSGFTYRGPKWLTNYGFEWLVRLVTEPKRLWKRYIIGNPLFFSRILYVSIQENLTSYLKNLR